jgi:hypothetical protein
MSSFVFILVAVVVSNGPEVESLETYCGLDLRGKWQGIWVDGIGREWEATAENGHVSGERPEFVNFIHAKHISDEGSGRVRILYPRVEPPALGIYQWRDDCLIICFREERLGRPVAFQGGNGQDLIILRRVKPAK